MEIMQSFISKSDISSERAAFYKKPIKRDNYNLTLNDIDTPQEARRQSLLKFQKECRDDSFNVGRGILKQTCNSEDEGDEEVMEVDKKKSKSYRRNKKYANQLMMSEWMWEVPEDFIDKWIAVPCPQGKRTLVVARKGVTMAYDKRGRQLAKFDSALPCGSDIEFFDNPQTSYCTMLDCIWIKDRETYVVLDVLTWSNQSLTNCDTEFRFFWLKSKFEERTELQIECGTSINMYKFLLLPTFNCDQLKMGQLRFESTSPFYDLYEHPTDGVLFYHKEGHYTKGRTPLVTWLKPFMLPEVLSVDVPFEWYETPSGYINYKQYIQGSRTRNKKGTSEDQMDMACDEVAYAVCN